MRGVIFGLVVTAIFAIPALLFASLWTAGLDLSTELGVSALILAAVLGCIYLIYVIGSAEDQ